MRRDKGDVPVETCQRLDAVGNTLAAKWPAVVHKVHHASAARPLPTHERCSDLKREDSFQVDIVNTLYALRSFLVYSIKP